MPRSKYVRACLSVTRRSTQRAVVASERSRERRGTMKRALMLDGARSPRSPVRSWTTNSELRALSLRSGCAASPMRDVAYASPCGARRDAYAGPILTCTCDVCACCAAWCRQAAESFHVGDGAPQCEVTKLPRLKRARRTFAHQTSDICHWRTRSSCARVRTPRRATVPTTTSSTAA